MAHRIDNSTAQTMLDNGTVSIKWMVTRDLITTDQAYELVDQQHYSDKLRFEIYEAIAEYEHDAA